MKVCISCHSDVEGKKATRIREDRIIRVIRTIKRTFGIAQMNELYECEDDMQEHRKRRQSFEKSMLFASVLAGIVVVMVLAALLLSGRFDPWPIVSAFIIGTFVLVLPLFKYAPALEGVPAERISKAVEAKAEKPKARKKTKKR